MSFHRRSASAGSVKSSVKHGPWGQCRFLLLSTPMAVKPASMKARVSLALPHKTSSIIGGPSLLARGIYQQLAGTLLTSSFIKSSSILWISASCCAKAPDQSKTGLSECAARASCTTLDVDRSMLFTWAASPVTAVVSTDGVVVCQAITSCGAAGSEIVGDGKGTGHGEGTL